MRWKLSYLIFFLILPILLACEGNCEDSIVTYPEPTEAAKLMVPYEPGETIQYISSKNDSVYHLNCITRKMVYSSDSTVMINSMCNDQQRQITNRNNEYIRLVLHSKDSISLLFDVQINISRQQRQWLNFTFSQVFSNNNSGIVNHYCNNYTGTGINAGQNKKLTDFTFSRHYQYRENLYENVSTMAFVNPTCWYADAGETLDYTDDDVINECKYNYDQGFLQFILTGGDTLTLVQ